MARLILVRRSFPLVLALAACRGDGRAADRESVHPSSAPVQSELAAGPASAGSAAPNAGSAAPAAPAPPPVGDDKLVVVPKDIADNIALQEIASGLKRPVALVAAPGDARHRLFIIEQ